MSTEEIEADIAAYTAGMMRNDVDACLKIERKYHLEEYSPERVSEGLADWLEESKIVEPEVDPRLRSLDWHEYGSERGSGEDREYEADGKRFAVGYQAPGYEMVGYCQIANYWTERAAKAKALEMYQRMARGVLA